MKALLLLLLTVPFTAAVSQGNELLLRPGLRLRLVKMDTLGATGEIRYSYPKGQLDAFEGGSLVLRSAGTASQPGTDRETVRVAMSGILLAEAFTGMKRHAGLGAAAGVVAGGMMGYLLSDSGSPGEGVQCVDGAFMFCQPSQKRSGTRLARAASGGAAGAALGAVVGYLIQTESWTQVDLAGMRLRFGVK